MNRAAEVRTSERITPVRGKLCGSRRLFQQQLAPRRSHIGWPDQNFGEKTGIWLIISPQSHELMRSGCQTGEKALGLVWWDTEAPYEIGHVEFARSNHITDCIVAA